MAKKPVKKKAPAKDLKAGDMRKTYAEGPKKKGPVKGTKTERMSEVKSRPYKGTKGGTPAKIERPRGNMNTARTPDSIRMGQGSKGSVTKPKVVPLRDKPLGLPGPKAQPKPGIGGTLAKGLFRGVGGPVTMLVSMTTEAGQGSDRPSGRIMRGMPQLGYGSKTSSADYGYKAKSRGPVGGARPETPGSHPSKKKSGNASKVGGPGGAMALSPPRGPFERGSGAQTRKPDPAAEAPKSNSRSSKTASSVTAPPKRRTARPATKYERDTVGSGMQRRPKGTLLGLLKRR